MLGTSSGRYDLDLSDMRTVIDVMVILWSIFDVLIIVLFVAALRKPNPGIAKKGMK